MWVRTIITRFGTSDFTPFEEFMISHTCMLHKIILLLTLIFIIRNTCMNTCMHAGLYPHICLYWYAPISFDHSQLSEYHYF